MDLPKPFLVQAQRMFSSLAKVQDRGSATCEGAGMSAASEVDESIFQDAQHPPSPLDEDAFKDTRADTLPDSAPVAKSEVDSQASQFAFTESNGTAMGHEPGRKCPQ